MCVSVCVCVYVYVCVCVCLCVCVCVSVYLGLAGPTVAASARVETIEIVEILKIADIVKKGGDDVERVGRSEARD